MALWLLSLRNFRIHWLKNILTTFGIVLGVAVFFTMHTANQSLRNEFRRTVDRVAGKAQLQVSAGEVGIPESVLETVQAVPGVAMAVPVIEAVVKTPIVEEGSLMLLGVDFLGDDRMREYQVESEDATEIEDPLGFLAQPDSICLTREFAARNHLRTGDPLELETAVGRRRFTVRGLIASGNLGSAFGGNLAVMDIYAAQFILHRPGKFDRVDLALEPGTSLDTARQRLREALGPGFRVDTPDQRGRQMETLTSAFGVGLLISSLVALLVGVFLIFNSFAMAVTRRRKDIGILRALGATRGQIQRLFLAEAAIMGTVGSGLGLLMGWSGARAVVAFMDRVIQQSYNVSVHTSEVNASSAFVLLAAGLGVCASLVGAFVPARAAAAVDPVLALQKGKHQMLTGLGSRRRALIGATVLTAILLVTFLPWSPSLEVQYGVFGLAFVALTLLVPALARFLARALRPVFGALFGIEGTLACDSLIQAPRRTSATVGALMFSLAFVVSNSTFTVSIKKSMTQWMSQTINADLFVTTSENLTTRIFHFPPTMGDAIRTLPGVRQVDDVRIINQDFRGNPILIFSIQMDQFFRRASFIIREGDTAALPSLLSEGDRVIVSNNFAVLYGFRTGDRLKLNTPSGDISFEIAGVMEDYSSDKGTVAMDRETYRRHWQDDLVDTFDIMLAPGADGAAVKRSILARFRDQTQLFVFTNQEFRQKILVIIDQFFSLSYVQVAVAIAVAVLGIINTLFISISDRRRDIGIFKVIGGKRHQVRKLILLEAFCIALVATLLGVLGGAYLAYFTNRTISLTLTGWWIPYSLDWVTALALFPAMGAVAVAAAWYPASSALKLPLVDALGYE